METQELKKQEITRTLQLFETTKEERSEYATIVLNEILEGNKNALDIHLQVKCLEDLTSQLKEKPEYKAELLEAVTRQLAGQKVGMYHNAEIKIMEAGTKYDYSQCNDLELIVMIGKANLINKTLKARQDFLKALPIEGIEIRVDDELVKIYPPSKSSTTTVAITLK